jgi:hypothetical protein
MSAVIESLTSLEWSGLRRVLVAALFTPLNENGDDVEDDDCAFMTITPGAQGPGFFGATPVPEVQDGELGLAFPIAARVRKRFRTRSGLLLTDDMVWTTPDVQAAQFDLVQRRVLGDRFLGNGVRAIGATNDVAHGGWPIPMAQRNRMGTLQMPTVPPDVFAAYLLSMEAPRKPTACLWGLPLLLLGPPGGAKSSILWSLGREWFGRDHQHLGEEFRVLAAWPRAWSEAAMAVAGFLRACPGKLQEEPASPTTMSWPTPRSVEMATRAFASAKVYNLSVQETNAFVAAFVGQGWANEFDHYREHLDLPNAYDVLDGKVTFTHDPHRLDRTFTVLAGTAAILSAQTCDRREERGQRFIALAEALAEHYADLLMVAVGLLDKTPEGRTLFSTREGTLLLVRMEPVITAARRAL